MKTRLAVLNNYFHLTRSQRAKKEGTINPQWVKVIAGPLKGYHLLLDVNSPLYWHREMMEGRYDSFIYGALDEYGSIEGVTVWDVGAHVGYHSFAFAALAGPSGRVVAFEPNPYNADRFRENLERNPDLAERVTLMTCALSDADGEASFLFSAEVDEGRSSGSHLAEALVPECTAAYRTFGKTSIPTAKADTLLRDGRVSLPSIMKIDVEGAERLVLEGAVKLLSTQKPLLFVEVHNITMMFQVQELLYSLGYTMEILDAEHSSLSRCFVMAKHRET